jgi:predicted DNA repair protein MutK
MASGLIALLDDVAAIAKLAAASLDDAAAQAAKASSKAAGIVIDDAAVTPRYVVGFAAERELPVIGRIAAGSLRNKFFWLLPGALILSFAAPWLITPLLMIGGVYLCLEGYHKVLDLVRPHAHGAHDAASPGTEENLTSQQIEEQRVASAVRTDFILSAEIMAIALGSVAEKPIWLQAIVLAVVGLAMTVLVYGAVAIIVKADDFGAKLALSSAGAARAAGRAIVTGMPGLLKGLSLIGMFAMLWVGGGILVHGLHVLGVHGPEAAIHHGAAEPLAKGFPVPALAGLIEWLVAAVLSGLIGLLVGAICDPLVQLAKRMRAPKA